MANGSSISTTLTTPASNLWNSRPHKSPVVPNSLAPILAPKNDLSLFSQPISLAPSSLFVGVPSCGLLLFPVRQIPASRQASPINRLDNYRHRLRCLRLHPLVPLL